MAWTAAAIEAPAARASPAVRTAIETPSRLICQYGRYTVIRGARPSATPRTSPTTPATVRSGVSSPPIRKRRPIAFWPGHTVVATSDDTNATGCSASESSKTRPLTSGMPMVLK